MKESPIYFTQINGLRFLAIMAVLLEHWLPEFIHLPLGHWGVVVFFVLSGFLITRILLRSKESLGASSPLLAIRNFVIRRTLRIFPIFYLVLGLGFVWNLPPIREHFWWFVGYLPNYLIVCKGSWLGVWDHFWSLAVEEQYYLFFPWLIYFSPWGKRPAFYWSMWCLSLGSRYYFYQFGDFSEQQWFGNYVNLLGALDGFGMGGLLAYYYEYKPKTLTYLQSKWYALALALIALGLALYALFHRDELPHQNLWFAFFERSVFAFSGVLMVLLCLSDRFPTWKALMEYKPLEYLGRISYGLYVYHNFVYNYYHPFHYTPWVVLLRKGWVPNDADWQFSVLRFILNFVILVIISTASWYLLEQPINRLKKNFN